MLFANKLIIYDKYKTINPIRIWVGDIAEVQVSFVMIPLKGRRFKLLIVLWAIIARLSTAEGKTVFQIGDNVLTNCRMQIWSEWTMHSSASAIFSNLPKLSLSKRLNMLMMLKKIQGPRLCKWPWILSIRCSLVNLIEVDLLYIWLIQASNDVFTTNRSFSYCSSALYYWTLSQSNLILD